MTPLAGRPTGADPDRRRSPREWLSDLIFYRLILPWCRRNDAVREAVVDELKRRPEL